MPEVFLTKEQREEKRLSDLLKCVGKRVGSAISDNKLTIAGVASGLGLGHTTLSKIIDGEVVRLNTDTWLKLLDLAGLKMVDRKKDAIQKEAEQ